MGEDGRAVAFHVLVEAQAKVSFGQHTSKRRLADLKRITPQIVAVQLDQVESVDEDTVLWRWWRMRSNDAIPLSSQATASPSIMQERRAQPGQRLDDQREAAGEVIAGTAVEPHPLTILAGNDSEAVMLDLM